MATEVFGVDINNYNNPNIKIADLAIESIPFEDNLFDFVTGFDFLEHIPRVLYLGMERRQPFIDVMSEIWRVLKPGGQTFFACKIRVFSVRPVRDINRITVWPHTKSQ